MKRKMVIYSCLFLTFFCFEKCRGKQLKNLIKYSLHGRFIIKESFDSSGKITGRQYFNKDTIPNGAEIYYYPNGKIKHWKWFQNNKTPSCGVYYDTDGVFFAFRGNPFIDLGNETDTSVYVTLVNPPNIKFIIVYEDTYKSKVMKSLMFEPTLTDSTSWIVIDRNSNEFLYQKEHKYELIFYVIDENSKVLSGAETALQLFDKGFTFIYPPKHIPQRIQ